MRDILITAIVFGSLPFILKRPWIGIIVWSWLSIMNPHRLAYGFAYNFPFALIVGVVTLLAVAFSTEPKKFPLNGVTITLLLFIAWMCVTTLFAMVPEQAWPAWDRAMKIQLMGLVALMVMNTRVRLHWFVWIMALSLGFYGVKGGLFAITSGGQYLVWGPAGSFIEDNNALSLALIMALPLMRYLQLQTEKKWVRRGLMIAMVLTALSIVASYSRGAFLAGIAMAFFMWVKGRKKFMFGAALVLMIPFILMFMPDKWSARMGTIETYSQDASAMGRINAWHFAWNIAKERPIVGGGYEVFVPWLFERYAPNPLDFHDAHSIYFKVLGEHGFPGLLLFLILAAATWRTGSWIVKKTRHRPELKWAQDLALMTQVSLVGFYVGGSFLGLAYFDLYYNLIAILVLTRVIVQRHLSESGALDSVKPSASFVRRPRPVSPGSF